MIYDVLIILESQSNKSFLKEYLFVEKKNNALFEKEWTYLSVDFF